MNRTVLGMLVLLALPTAGSFAADDDKYAPEVVLIKGATVWTQASQGVVENADVLIRNGKIDGVGKGLSVPSGTAVIDGAGKHVTPGLIDCHSHAAIRGGVNEGSNNVTAEVRIEDVIDPDDVDLYRQLAGGLTAAHLLHGSANSIGGQDAVIKLRWHAKSAEELLIPDAWQGIKFALGENPKRSNFRRPGQPQRYPATRMGVMESIRERFVAAREYMREWDAYDRLASSVRERTAPPREDLQLAAIAEILRGERRIHSHSYRQDEILALLRLCDEFGITIATFQHVLEGYKVADELAAHGAGGSTFSDWWAYKLEAYDAIPYNGALMHDRGVSVSFNSDSSELARRMNLEAAKAVKWGGLDEAAALNFVTLNAARQLGIDRRTGSLEKGKDADVVVWSGHPLSVFSIAEQTWVDGVREFDRATDLAGRAAVAEQRTALIEQVRKGRDAKKDGAPDGETEEGEKDDTADAEKEPPQVDSDATESAEPVARVAPQYSDRLASLAGAVSIVHATVHTVSGGTIDDGTVSFRNGVIVEVGKGAAPLRNAQVIDATGKHVWPGMIDLNTAVGLTEVSSVAGSVDVSETGSINPNATTAIAVNPASELIPVTRANGLTHVLAVPSGGLVSGTSALIRLDGWTWEDLAAVRHAGLHVNWPGFGGGRRFFGPPVSDEDLKKQREERFKQIRQLFDDARAYRKAREADDTTDIDGRLEALLPVLAGEVPVIVHASEIRQIKSAIEWAEEEGLPFVLAGAGDVWRVADMLAEKDIPVILTGVLGLPSRDDEPYDVRYAEASVLHEAGVNFAIATSGGTFAAAMVRSLPYHAAMAAAFGLPRDAALRAITLGPARVLGLEDRLGTIEKGKSASLIVTDGDPLEIRTRIEQVFIDGRAIDPDDNKHHRLYERYRSRPTVAPGS